MRKACSLACLVGMFVTPIANGATARSLEANVTPLLKGSCLVCHSDGTGALNSLNLQRLGFDLADPGTFRLWAKVFDRVERGDMPPAGTPQPDQAILEPALASLQGALVDASLAARAGQRTPLRRLTRLEYAYTVQDLLLIDAELGKELSETLPA